MCNPDFGLFIKELYNCKIRLWVAYVVKKLWLSKTFFCQIKMKCYGLKICEIRDSEVFWNWKYIVNWTVQCSLRLCVHMLLLLGTKIWHNQLTAFTAIRSQQTMGSLGKGKHWDVYSIGLYDTGYVSYSFIRYDTYCMNMLENTIILKNTQWFKYDSIQYTV